MSTTALVVIVVAAVVVLGALGIFADRQRRRRQLRDRFGPEYDRTINASPNARRAEADLQRRAAERDRLSIRQLSATQRDRYDQEWRQVQADFVDVPGSSLARADALVTDVMVDCGYPVRDFEQRADLVSVDHPQVVELYRQAHGIFLASRSIQVSTEDIRRAFVSYRALFAELLGDNDSANTPPPDTQQRGVDQSSASY